MDKVRFVDSEKKKFFVELKREVDAYFKDNNISKNANFHMKFKTVFFLTVLFGTYFVLLFGNLETTVGTWVVYPLWIVIGLFSAFSAVNVGHDAIHGAYSKKAKWNDFLSHSFNILGASAYMWKTMHNQSHHTFTNIDHHDEDIISVPIIRMAPSQKWMPVHKFQHIFSFFLYPLGTLSWVFIKDYKKFYQPAIGSIKQKHKTKDHVMLYVYKAIYYALFIAIPLIVVEAPIGHLIGAFIVGHLFEGFTLAVIFMLAHVVEEVEFPMYDEENKVYHGWAEHQMRTTANFATNSFLANFLTGGLNFQVEHHLFPLICHTHYPKISPIVERISKKYDIPYNNGLSYFGAVRSHIRHLKTLGQKPIAA